MRLFGTGPPGGFRGEVPGKTSISLHLKAPDCEKIDILNTFFPSEFFQYNDDFYGDLYGNLYDDFYRDFYGIVDTFVATNFLISLSSSLYMILILFYYFLKWHFKGHLCQKWYFKGHLCRSHPPPPLATRLL